jgi:hypothetical protein
VELGDGGAELLSCARLDDAAELVGVSVKEGLDGTERLEHVALRDFSSSLL